MATKPDIKKYIKERFVPSQQWYSERASSAKRTTYALQISIIVLSVLTTVFAALQWPILTITSSALVAIGTGVLRFGRFEEHWFNYRATSETLKKEEQSYKHRVSVYANATNPDALFIERVESLISTEHTSWSAIVNTSKEKK